VGIVLQILEQHISIELQGSLGELPELDRGVQHIFLHRRNLIHSSDFTSYRSQVIVRYYFNEEFEDAAKCLHIFSINEFCGRAIPADLWSPALQVRDWRSMGTSH
jgi:hypothetical protein